MIVDTNTWNDYDKTRRLVFLDGQLVGAVTRFDMEAGWVEARAFENAKGEREYTPDPTRRSGSVTTGWPHAPA